MCTLFVSDVNRIKLGDSTATISCPSLNLWPRYTCFQLAFNSACSFFSRSVYFHRKDSEGDQNVNTSLDDLIYCSASPTGQREKPPDYDSLKQEITMHIKGIIEHFFSYRQHLVFFVLFLV